MRMKMAIVAVAFQSTETWLVLPHGVSSLGGGSGGRAFSGSGGCPEVGEAGGCCTCLEPPGAPPTAAGMRLSSVPGRWQTEV